MSGTVDIQGDKSCYRYDTIKDVVLPGIGHSMEAQAEFLYDQAITLSTPLTEAETQRVYRDLQRASATLNKLKKLPDGWDRAKVEGQLSWIMGVYKKAIDEKRGLRANCEKREILVRLEPSVTKSTIRPSETRALLRRFGLNRQGADLPTYLGGRVLAGKQRPKANKLIILLGDNHMSADTQRHILRAVWNLTTDGAAVVGLELASDDMKRMLRDEDVRHMMSLGFARSLDKTLAHYEKTAALLKQKMEKDPPLWRMYSFYPTLARMMVMAAFVGQDKLVGVDDGKLIKDMNMTCHTEEWGDRASVTLSEPEKLILWEACLRYTVELRSHLAVRELVRHAGPAAKREVLVLPFGKGHLMSLLGELLKPAYKNYSYLAVSPTGVFEKSTEGLRWLRQIRDRSSKPFQLHPVMQDHPRQYFERLQPSP